MIELFISFISVLLYTFFLVAAGYIPIFFLQKYFSAPMPFSSLAILATSFLTGLGLVANVWIILSILGIFNFETVLVISLILTIIGGFLIFPLVKDLLKNSSIVPSKLSSLSWYWKFVLVLCGIQVIFLGLQALFLPPRGDAVAFYMVLPKIIANSQHLSPLPGYESFTQIGLIGEHHLATLMLLGSDRAAKFLLWIIGIFTGLFILLFCRLLKCGTTTKVLALAMLVTTTAFTNILIDGKIDVFGAIFGLGAYLWLLYLFESRGPRETKCVLFITGFFTGCAVVAKYSNIPVLLPGIFLGIIIYSSVKPPEMAHLHLIFRKLVQAVAILLAGMTLPIIVNICKNNALFGQPFAPFIITVQGASSFLAQSWYTPENYLWIVLTYPLALVYGQYPMQYGNLSPLILLCVPFFIYCIMKKTKWERKFSIIFTFFVVGVGLSVIINRGIFAPRYILATLLLSIILAACLIDKVCNNRKYIAFNCKIIAIATIIILTGTIGMNMYILTLTHPWSEQIDDDLNYQASQVLNNVVPAGERVFHFGYYSFWMRPDIIQCKNCNNDLPKMGSCSNELKAFSIIPENERWNFLRDHNFHYLFFDGTFSNSSSVLNLDNPPKGIVITDIFNKGDYRIFKLDYRNQSLPASYSCQQLAPSYWRTTFIPT